MPTSAAKTKKEAATVTDEKLERFRDAAILNLSKSMRLCMDMIDNPNLAPSVKIKWAHCLAQTSAALCNIIKAMGRLAGSKNKTFAEHMSLVAEKVMELQRQSKKGSKTWMYPKYRKHLKKLILDTRLKVSRKLSDP